MTARPTAPSAPDAAPISAADAAPRETLASRVFGVSSVAKRPEWRPIDPTPAWRVDDAHGRKFRHGWLFAAIWLIYLADPVSAIHKHHGGPVQVLGYVALAMFAVLYVGVFVKGRRDPRPGLWLLPLGKRLAIVSALLGLGLLTLPAAGSHGLATGVYVSAASMMLLPVRYAWGLVAVLVAAIATSAYVVPGWGSEGSGNGLGVLLAGLAVFGMRLAFERNAQLVIARDEVAQLAVSAERERMARDMHDILGHSLTVITVKAELAGRLIDVDPARASAEIADLERLSREALADVRATIGGFREVTLARELANARSALTAAGITPDLPGAVDEVPGEHRELFGWAVREGVTNVVRHSGASRCTVRVSRDLVEVIDDGRGVSDCMPGTVGAGAEQAPGHGLSGLRERARAAGATMSVGRGEGGSGFRLSLDASGAA
jgi:two-component system sensor histidine kinase DesK